jgi:hypothetical protein
MKRTVICAALVAALAIPAAALAAKQTFFGKVKDQPDATVKLRTANDGDGEPVVRSFTVKNFVLDCAAGPAVLQKGRLSGAIPIGNRGGFAAVDDNGDTTFKVRGRIDGRKAKGTWRYFGDVPSGDGSVDENCDSRRQEWKARAG